MTGSIPLNKNWSILLEADHTFTDTGGHVGLAALAAKDSGVRFGTPNRYRWTAWRLGIVIIGIIVAVGIERQEMFS